MQKFFAALEEHMHKNLPFVAYRHPSAQYGVIKAFLQRDSEIYQTENFTESGFVFAPFNTEAKALIIPDEFSDELQMQYSALEEKKKVKKEEVDFPLPLFTDQDQIAYEKLVQKAMNAIELGKFKKVVLSRKEKMETQMSAINIFRSLLRKYSTAFVYIWFHPKTGMWLGATPETLVQVERNQFKTMALAGTQAFKDKREIEVEWGTKEKEEQQIVTESILESLGSTEAEKVQKSEPYTIKAGSLLHLRTDISGHLKPGNFSLKQIIRGLHPTSAICGFPKEASKSFILEYENYNREYYTGFLGELNLYTENKRNKNRKNQENQVYSSLKKQTTLYVNLRCMKLKEGRVHLFVGGGITKDSNPALEWKETISKSHTMKSVLVK